MDGIVTGRLEIEVFPSEIWTPLLAYLELDAVMKLVLCGSARANRRIFQSVRSASVKYRGGVRIVWPSILSSFSALESIALLPSASQTFFDLDFSSLHALPPTLKSLQVKIEANNVQYWSDELGFPESHALSLAKQCPHLNTLELAVLGDSILEQFVSSISQMSSLTSLALPELTSERVERLPPSLLHLKLGNFEELVDDQPIKFPNSLQTFELDRVISVNAVSCLPQSLRTLRALADVKEVVQDCSVFPQSLTRIHLEADTHGPANLVQCPNVVFPPTLRHLYIEAYFRPSQVKQLPTTLETLVFKMPNNSFITWSDMPPNVTECTMLPTTSTSYGSLPRKLKRFASWKSAVPTLSVKSADAGLAVLPQSLEELAIELLPDSTPRDDASYSYRHIVLPPSLTKLSINVKSGVESHCAKDFIEIVNGSLPNLKHLTCRSNLPSNMLCGLKVSLEYLRFLEYHEGTSDLIQFREKSASGDEVLSLASPSMRLLSWCASLKVLEYCVVNPIDVSWMKTLPSTLESLILSESDMNVPLPHSSIILSLPPRITCLVMRVAAILPGDIAKLPRTLVDLKFTTTRSMASYPPEDLLSLPRGLIKLTISRNNETPHQVLKDDYLTVQRFPHLNWKAF